MAGGFSLRVLAEEPDREWVVMLPGAGATSAVWFLQVRRFRKQFNVALVDLPGHGGDMAAAQEPRPPYSFPALADALGATVRAAGIRRCHVVALSLGTILARHWASRDPGGIRSMVLAGTIADLRPFARVLMRAGRMVRWALPYMLLYRLYAWTIMPGAAHRVTRRLFYRDARLLGRAEFDRWFALSRDVIPVLRALRAGPALVPTLHVLGGGDYMFRGAAERLASAQRSEIAVIPSSGHACPVEAAEAFNQVSLEFLERLRDPA